MGEMKRVRVAANDWAMSGVRRFERIGEPAAKTTEEFTEKLEEDFTCPKCGGHQFMTEWTGESWAPWRVVCQHDKCGWSGRYREHVYKVIATMPPKALFNQLRKMGVSCSKCSKYLQDTSKVGSTGLCEMYYVSMASADEFFCDEWEATSPPTE